ncbi:polysaccharide biosynthesis/export family protein [Oxalobacteraceae bacterium OTU3CINTB1]|nr:polysaccharide biosynthesis/export family protein [Oxalobacteraceae bacterium OTU3CINTB1]
MHNVTPSIFTVRHAYLPARPPRAPRLAFFFAFALCMLGGCATGMHSAPAPEDAEVIPITEQWLDAEQKSNASAPAAGQDLGSLAVTEPGLYTYILGVGDVLAITLWDHPELTGAVARDQGVDGAGLGPPAASFVIDQHGKLQFPFAGSMDFAGLTREQAGALLTKRLARYFRDPRVTLSVQAYRSQRVYIDGEVRTPGLQTVNDIPMTLLEAVNRAGGLTPNADQSRITVERAGRRHQVDLIRALRDGRHAAAVMLANGDIVRVPPRDESKVFVAGEVLQPRSLTMHDGRLTLNEALGEVGGINPQSGDAGQVYVVRQTAQGPRVYRLDARPSRALALAERFALRPKDVVYVAASPLANWHRAISQLFPGELSSAVGATTRP